ncbi:hypothetical protein MMC28_003883 [Mycoblastus sanguinarius]|nr:hypothetical protein [Mycoblastus sanguinarius]
MASPPNAHNPTWHEEQARMITNLRHVETPPSTVPSRAVRKMMLQKGDYHTLWSDAGLVGALERMEDRFGKLAFRYGGRTEDEMITWVVFYVGDSTKLEGLGEMVFVLWFHEEGDEDVDGRLEEMVLE